MDEEEKKDKEFVDAYNKLCEKHKRTIRAVPAWRFSQDGNDFRLIIEIHVVRTEET